MKRLILIAALASLTGCASVGGAISAGGYIDGVYIQTQVVAPVYGQPAPYYDYGPRRVNNPYYQTYDPYYGYGGHRHDNRCRH